MPKRKVIETSKAAFQSLDPDQIRDIYQKIMGALKVLGSASTEQIALFLTLEHARVHKRTSEMGKLEMIYRPGTKVKTKSGRMAYQWAICGQNQPKTTTEKALKGGKTVADFSREIIKKPAQTDLFLG